MPSYRITRWTRLTWWLEDWAPFYFDGWGKRRWVTPWAYAALVWDRLIGRRNWPLLKTPERPKRRFLVVPIDMRRPYGIGDKPGDPAVDWEWLHRNRGSNGPA